MRYFLNHKNKDGSRSIFIEVGLGTIKLLSADGRAKYKAIRFRSYTGESIHPKYWDKKNCRVRGSVSNADELNEFLNDLENQVRRFRREARLKGEQLTLQYLKERFLPKKEKAKPTITVIDALQSYIDQHEHSLAEGTLKNFKTLKVDLEDIIEEYKKPLSFESINQEWFLKFQAFLYSVRDNKDNTFAKKTEKLKTFLRWARESGFNQNNDFEKFKAPRKPKDIVWLTEEEVSKIENHKGLSESLEKTKDVFMFGCYTGLRYSDIENLKSENVQLDDKGNRILRLVMCKTKKQLVIPLIEQAAKYLDKYNTGSGSIFNCATNQAMNDNLKDLCEEAKIDTVFQRVTYQGAKRIELSLPKWNFISTHSARHSYSINSLKKGMKVEVLQKYLGHHDISETMGYVHIAESYMQDHVRNVWNTKTEKPEDEKGKLNNEK